MLIWSIARGILFSTQSSKIASKHPVTCDHRPSLVIMSCTQQNTDKRLKMTDSKQALLDAIECMNSSTKPAVFDVTIVCTTDDYQAEFWTKRLAEGVCHVADKDSQFPMVLAVSEDWSPAGAGNGLGTLYAFQKACKVAKELHDGVDIDALLQEGKISAALYHTAGKGTRLAPLPASENNNKPGVVSNHENKTFFGIFPI